MWQHVDVPEQQPAQVAHRAQVCPTQPVSKLQPITHATGAVMSLNKKMYLSLCVSSTNVLTVWFNGAKHSYSEQNHQYLNYSTDFFFFNSMEVENTF